MIILFLPHLGFQDHDAYSLTTFFMMLGIVNYIDSFVPVTASV